MTTTKTIENAATGQAWQACAGLWAITTTEPHTDGRFYVQGGGKTEREALEVAARLASYRRVSASVYRVVNRTRIDFLLY